MKKIRSKKTFVFIAVVVLVIFFHFLGILSPIERIFFKALSPVAKGFYSLSSSIRIKYNEQTSKVDLYARIRELESQFNQLADENANLKMIEAENSILREHLQFLSEKKYKYVMSNVISRGDIGESSERTETILIDKGLKEGVYAGLPVLSSQGIIIGKIAEAKEDIAKVILTNNVKCKLAATVLNQQKTSGVTEGELGLTIKMGFIPQFDQIKAGDMIITSGLERTIPRGLIIGRVAEVKKESNELWQTATIEPMVDSDELVIVSVLIP